VRVLLDECVPRRLKGDLAGHEVRTVAADIIVILNALGVSLALAGTT